MTKVAFYRLLFLCLLVTGLTGCITWLPEHKLIRMYKGSERDISEISVIYNDRYVFVSPRWHHKIALLPGEQTIDFSFSKVVGSMRYYSKKPYPLKVTLEKGHRYQVVGYDSTGDITFINSAGRFTPTIEDITTQSNIWDYYQMNLSEEHMLRAVKFLEDQDLLEEAALSNPKPNVRFRAVEKIDDIDFLNELLTEEIDAKVRHAAEVRIYTLGLEGNGTK